MVSVRKAIAALARSGFRCYLTSEEEIYVFDETARALDEKVQRSLIFPGKEARSSSHGVVIFKCFRREVTQHA